LLSQGGRLISNILTAWRGFSWSFLMLCGSTPPPRSGPPSWLNIPRSSVEEEENPYAPEEFQLQDLKKFEKNSEKTLME